MRRRVHDRWRRWKLTRTARRPLAGIDVRVRHELRALGKHVPEVRVHEEDEVGMVVERRNDAALELVGRRGVVVLHLPRETPVSRSHVRARTLPRVVALERHGDDLPGPPEQRQIAHCNELPVAATEHVDYPSAADGIDGWKERLPEVEVNHVVVSERAAEQAPTLGLGYYDARPRGCRDLIHFVLQPRALDLDAPALEAQLSLRAREALRVVPDIGRTVEHSQRHGERRHGNAGEAPVPASVPRASARRDLTGSALSYEKRANHLSRGRTRYPLEYLRIEAVRRP